MSPLVSDQLEVPTGSCGTSGDLEIPLHHKESQVKIFNSNVLSVLLYGCETWRMTIGGARKLRAFHHRYLRRILRIRWFHKKSNAEVLKMANAKDIWREAETRRILDTVSVAPNQFNTLACHGLLRALGGVGGLKRRGESQSFNACSPAVLWGGGEAAARAKDRSAWKEMEDVAVMSLCVRRLSAT